MEHRRIFSLPRTDGAVSGVGTEQQNLCACAAPSKRSSAPIRNHRCAVDPRGGIEDRQIHSHSHSHSGCGHMVLLVSVEAGRNPAGVLPENRWAAITPANPVHLSIGGESQKRAHPWAGLDWTGLDRTHSELILGRIHRTAQRKAGTVGTLFRSMAFDHQRDGRLVRLHHLPLVYAECCLPRVFEASVCSQDRCACLCCYQERLVVTRSCDPRKIVDGLDGLCRRRSNGPPVLPDAEGAGRCRMPSGRCEKRFRAAARKPLPPSNKPLGAVWTMRKRFKDWSIDAKTVSIGRLLEVMPEGAEDPTPFIYDTTCYAAAGLTRVAWLANQAIWP
eukprot:jgi/Psemu1/5050/gm1.5050_g